MAHERLQRNGADLCAEQVKDPQAACDSASIPHPSEARLFIHYDTHLRRQLHRALAALRHLTHQGIEDLLVSTGRTHSQAVKAFSHPISRRFSVQPWRPPPFRESRERALRKALAQRYLAPTVGPP